ncbi:diguanylate cyclase domain-containing protein [Sulfurimonas sp.]|uniref:diguanylate cyclase domain-containing protein n=1 Tax=Sulfurimonas sp. TaxID=2022749 RepID=UPI0035655A73
MLEIGKKCLEACINIGALPTDSESQRLKKASLTMVPLIVGPTALVWGLLYIYLDHYLSAFIPLSYSLISLYNLWHLNKTKDIVLLQKIQMILVLILPFLLMWSLGGFALGSFVMIWAFFAPIAALTYEESEKALPWFHAFMSLVVVSAVIDQTLIENHTTFMPQIAVELFFLLNISVGLSGIYFLIKYFIDQKEKNANTKLEAKHEKLLVTTVQLEKANEKLKYRAHHDELTDIPNRYLLKEELVKLTAYAIRHKHSVALLFIDLDGFKEVNDNYGHAKGDEVLQTVASRIKSLLRKEDIIARIGGDEFAVAIGALNDLVYVEKVAKRIIVEVSKDYEGLPASSVGASIGISVFPKHTTNIDSLFNYADKAMYSIKKSSKNDFMIYSESV